MLLRMAFLGRERELAQLAEAVRRVAEGRLGRVVLTGPAGIGCTRLLDELSTRVSSVPGVLACRGRAYEPAMGMPYQAVGDALACSFGQRARRAHGRGRGRRRRRPLRARARTGERASTRSASTTRRPRSCAPDQLGRRVLESILGTLERLADGGVMLLMLEDVHFADPATRMLIEALQDVGRALPVCLVITYQPDEVHRRHPMQALADRLTADPEVVRIELGPLGGRELEQLVVDALGERPPRTS